MTKLSTLAACVAATFFTAGNAVAQSSIGTKGASFSFAGISPDDGDAFYEGDIMLDVAISEYHGLQGDLYFTDTGNGLIGRVGGHAYLAPGEGRKYGLFGTFADLDNASYSYVQAGIEGMWAIGENASVEARAGMGMASDDLDYIFAGAAVHYALSDTFNVTAALDVAEFDEAGFSAIGTNASFGVEYDMPSAPVVAFAEVRTDMLNGTNGAPSLTSAVLGLRIRLGSSGGVDPATRPFRTSDPIAQLVRRGLF